jgi:hypothetical protein
MAATSERVYVPLTPTLLRRAREEGGLDEPPLAAHAVTPELVDADESEYAALTAAAHEALSLLRPDEPARRIVAAVDVPSWEPRPDGEHPSAVSVPTRVPWRRVATVHVDSEEAVADVAAALGGTPEAVERCLEHELGWFGVQEVDELVEHLSWGS